MFLIEQRPDRYLRSPRLIARDDGGADLFVQAWTNADERALQGRLTEAGELIGELAATAAAERVYSGADRVDDERSYEAAGERVLVEYTRGSSRVVLERAAQRVDVWQAQGIAAAPTLARIASGTWVAFHHNVREDTGASDIAKWVVLYFVDDGGRVFEPECAMLGLNRDAEGEEQGFEFPALIVGRDGALTVFGRGSHTYWRQDLNAAGFSERSKLDDGAWGCRGRRIAVVALTNGSLLTAARVRRGIVVQSLTAPTGGPPKLRVRAERTRVVAGHIATPAAPEPHTFSTGEWVLFGDIHQHTAHSDACGTLDEPYLRARYHYGDDVVAVSDHESFIGKRMGPREWRHAQEVADAHYEPGAFVTLYAYEWTCQAYPGPGHKVIYPPERTTHVLSRDLYPTGAALNAEAQRLGALVIPHHVGWTGADADAHDPAVQPVWEVVSCHGCYEYAKHPLGQRGSLDDQMIQPMLGRGLLFGLVGGSDSHGLLWHHGVGRKRDPFRTGLTGFIVREKTREAVLDALRSRRCFATSGAKIVLELRAGAALMGALVTPGAARTVHARVQGTAPIDRLELIAEGGAVIATTRGSGVVAELEAPLPTSSFIYARAVQADGEWAWSSPIFVRGADLG